MTPGKYDLAIYRGDSYAWRFTLWQDAAKSIAVDLTGGVAKCEIRDKSAGSVIVPVACTITTPNIIDAELSATESATVPASGVWDLQVTFPGGDVRTYVAGVVKTTADVTDSTPLVLAGRR